jgi:hypothetical protein
MFIVIQPKSWDDMRHLVSQMQGKWVFRGQSNSEWGLSSSLERTLPQIIQDNDKKDGERQKIIENKEKLLLREFKRRAHHYILSLPVDSESLEWLALIQHYGGATRLLDFSHSFYVAAFFAVEENKREYENSAIWGISLTNIDKIIQQKIDDRYKNIIIKKNNAEYIKLAHEIFSNSTSNRFVFGVEPERMNERLAIQQGLFLFPGNVGATFEENLANLFDSKSTIFLNTPSITYEPGIQTALQNGIMALALNYVVVLKIIIPQYLREEMLKDLWKMNVSSATLFPGIDGFTHSLNYHLLE